MHKIQLNSTFEHIISLENILAAWKEFIIGKKSREDVQYFQRDLMSNIILLHRDCTSREYQHGEYQAFNISDPKPRNIHKATVRDRLFHHSLYRQLYPFFTKVFIADSFSCRIGKGTHKALNRFRSFTHTVSRNNTRTAWVLKCDIRKFFANIDHMILKEILAEYIPDINILWSLSRVIGSFETKPGIGLPLGNLTSQLLVNIIRYADDFVIFSSNKGWLEEVLPKIGDFLYKRLKLHLHPDKVFIKTIASGVDFLGWVHFPDYQVLRTVAKRRMFKRMIGRPSLETKASYLGLLKHGNTAMLRKILECSAFRQD